MQLFRRLETELAVLTADQAGSARSAEQQLRLHRRTRSGQQLAVEVPDALGQAEGLLPVGQHACPGQRALAAVLVSGWYPAHEVFELPGDGHEGLLALQQTETKEGLESAQPALIKQRFQLHGFLQSLDHEVASDSLAACPDD